MSTRTSNIMNESLSDAIRKLIQSETGQSLIDAARKSAINALHKEAETAGEDTVSGIANKTKGAVKGIFNKGKKKG